ncbi:MAG: molybdopterin-binding protein, partial [Parasphingopyxis sp.]
MTILTTRRKLIAGLGGSALLAGCDSWSRSDRVTSILSSAEGLNMTAQRALAGDALAREYAPSEMSPVFRMNGNRTADTPEYQRMLANNFADYRLRLDGLVER